MLLVLQDLLGNYQETDITCTRSTKELCDAMVLGSLLQGIQKVRLWPFPEPPYEGLTVQGLREAILSIKIKTFCDYIEPGGNLKYHDKSYSYLSTPRYGRAASDIIKEWIVIKINTIFENLSGLKFEDFNKT
jgi:hypothetical protein